MSVSLLFPVLGSAAADNAPRPNVLFILADDLGWGDLGCYGNTEIRTPNLDQLASQGTLFTQFYVNSAVCSPSRTAFLTGRYPARFSMHGHLATAEQNRARGMPNWLDPAAPLLPKLLKKAGYRTAHFGKWHLGSGPGAPGPDAYGFDTSKSVTGSGSAWDEQADEYFRARSSALIVDEALRFIEQRPDQPFYVQCWTLLTHATLHPTPEQLQPYARFAPGGVPYHGTKQIYYASVSELDRQIGRLLARLDKLGLAENTLVVFSSDNGPEDINIRNAVHSGVGSAGPLRGRKRSLYEGGVRVPFIVRWPKGTPKGRIEATAVVSGVDWLPTIARLAGVEVPADWAGDGEDASELLQGKSRPRSRPIHWEWRFRVAGHVWNRSPLLALRDGEWKLLMNPDRSRVELFQVPHDPMEQNNLADRHPELVERLAQELLAWQKTLPAGPIEPAAGKNDYPWPGTAARSGSEPSAARKATKKQKAAKP
jgi:N-acetylgalactosamine-6-sulfatase